MNADSERQQVKSLTDKYRLLLAHAETLYERHGTGHEQRFNVFSVLRSESDEVNLHSRFLAALLDHKAPMKDERLNLKDFLESVANVQCFEFDGVSVEREKYQIDILIRSSTHAVIIENKIWAGDQPQQLQRYHSELTNRGYTDDGIHLCYLTPFGNHPSKDSVGSLRFQAIAYSDAQFQNWLRSCQQRASDEPWLRETVAQYLSVVQKITGTDMKHAHLKALTDLLGERDHLLFAYDLRQAFSETWAQRVEQFFLELSEDLNRHVHEIFNTKKSFFTEGNIRDVVSGTPGAYFALHFELNVQTKFKVNVDKGRLWFSVECDEKNYDEQLQLIRPILRNGGSYTGVPWWTWSEAFAMDVRYPTRDEVSIFTDEEKRQESLVQVAMEAQETLRKLEDAKFIQ